MASTMQSSLSPHQQAVCSIIPHLSFASHKGQAGRIGVIGGSKEYTGAPYFAAISALKVGCDLAHVVCTSDAAQVIKSYSPELIVYPVLDSPSAVDEINAVLPRLHSLVIGPGLGRNECVFKTVRSVLAKARELHLPLVLDADALFFLNTNLDSIRGYEKAILTPNVAEFARLYSAVFGVSTPVNGGDPKVIEEEDVIELSRQLGNVTVVLKGNPDIISNGREVVRCMEKGSPRRCGGQGDLLSGSMAVFNHWGHSTSRPSPNRAFSAPVIAALGACMLTRRCSRMAFQNYARSMTTSDMVREIRLAFVSLFPVD